MVQTGLSCGVPAIVWDETDYSVYVSGRRRGGRGASGRRAR